MGILSGLRVLDLATYIAAPAAATILSDFGAEVVKVERPPHGDPYRYLSLVPGMPVSEEQYCWLLDGRNKQSVALNLSAPEARGIVERLVKWCDVLITNFQPQQLEKFGLRYEDVAPWNERMIYASVTGYGEAGEEAEKPGFDMTAYWARSGLMSTIHNAGADPAPSPAGFGDHPTAMALFGVIMMALYRREKTGKGGKVTTSLAANGAWSNSCNLQAAFVGAEWPARRTRLTPSNPLVNHYVSKDGKRFMLCLLEPSRDWVRLCMAFGWADLVLDERFHTVAARRDHARELVPLIDEVVATKTMAEWDEIFRTHEVVWGIVPSTEETARDAQMEAAGVFVPFTDAPWKTVMSPVAVEGETKVSPRRGSAVGADTDAVLDRLGYSAEERQMLRLAGVAGMPTK